MECNLMRSAQKCIFMRKKIIKFKLGNLNYALTNRENVIFLNG